MAISDIFSGFGNALSGLSRGLQPLADWDTNRRNEETALQLIARSSDPAASMAQYRQQRIQEENVQRLRQQQSALRELAQQGLDPANPVEYFRRAAAITGDTTALDRYLTQTIGGRPAPMRMADEYRAAQQSGDIDRMNALELFAKVFDKGVFTGGGQGLFGGTPGYNPAANVGSFNPNAGNPAASGVLEQAPSGGVMPPPLDMTALEQLTNPDMVSPQAAPIPSPAGVSAMPSGFGVPAGYSQAVSGIAGDKAAATERAKLLQKAEMEPFIEAQKQAARGEISEREKQLRSARQSYSLASRNAGNVIQDSGRAIEILQKAGNAAAGWGTLLSSIPSTDSRTLKGHIDSVKSNIGIDKLLEIKASGAGLGHIPQSQFDMLSNTLGNLDQAQTVGDLMDNIKRMQNIYADVLRQARGGAQEFGIDTSDTDFVERFVPSELSFDEFGRTIPPAQKPKIAINPQTGERLINRGNGWE